MALLLDTTTIDSRSVVDELHHALRSAGAAPTATVTPLVPHHRFRAQVSGWTIGEGATLMHVESDPVSVATTRSRLRTEVFERVAIAAVSPGSWSHRQHGVLVESTDRASTLLIVDQACPYDFRRSDRGSAVVLTIDAAHLNLPPSALAAAVRTLRPSHGLYQLYLSFLDELLGIAVANPALLPELNSTAILLTHALIIDVADRPAADQGPDAPGDLVARIRRHIDENVDDPDISADTIAQAHSISVRTLYKAWAVTGIGLQDHIMGRRLDRARETLIREPDLTVSAVARRHGFVDSTHFTHRFRDRFSVTPRDWRLMNP
ncbi:helix-turn-helix transcriptional regulator [Gordonia insulae]|uniref:Transcriptional activator NphR n=1 Tax=Gordonia insulae TaxID=2420509 RepID=A0A3G8JJ27_9ACTN|nr:helix-turn-helix transcriptional regulator [Gordonia insulae]AZG44479.1 Transcriptional activator NphR [Gordonia insulae]